MLLILRSLIRRPRSRYNTNGWGAATPNASAASQTQQNSSDRSPNASPAWLAKHYRQANNIG
ncbi:MAG: hypothetical protein H6668_02030 [Ardenticatenaceae bacterium]|nr:hypothetical protein [Ardenticatenaceae bacterium]